MEYNNYDAWIKAVKDRDGYINTTAGEAVGVVDAYNDQGDYIGAWINDKKIGVMFRYDRTGRMFK